MHFVGNGSDGKCIWSLTFNESTHRILLHKHTDTHQNAFSALPLCVVLLLLQLLLLLVLLRATKYKRFTYKYKYIVTIFCWFVCLFVRSFVRLLVCCFYRLLRDLSISLPFVLCAIYTIYFFFVCMCNVHVFACIYRWPWTWIVKKKLLQLNRWIHTTFIQYINIKNHHWTLSFAFSLYTFPPLSRSIFRAFEINRNYSEWL